MWLKYNLIWIFPIRALNSADKLLYFQEARKLALITIREMWGLGLELPSLGLGFYDKVSVSSRNLSQVSVSEVTVSTTSLVDSTISLKSSMYVNLVFIYFFFLKRDKLCYCLDF